MLTGCGLEAEVLPTAGKPAVVARHRAGADAPTLLIYGHYDVQPPEPLELWKSPPFAPQVRDGRIYARGADDDKGQLFTHLMALEAWQKADGGLPINVTVLAEGEEEIGSPNLEPFMAANARLLSADAAVISDAAFFAEGLPSITYALRGLVYAEVTVRGPDHDLHSGLYGGAVANPANALARIVAGMHDDGGRVTIPGFYDDVIPASDEELAEWRKLPFDAVGLAREAGVGELAGGESGRDALERMWARPTLDCNGIVGGYTARGSKTIIPASASAKISMRLVAAQKPSRVADALRSFVAGATPAGCGSEVVVAAEAAPVCLRTDTQAMDAARRAYVEGFGREPALIRCGASVPVTEVIQRLLGVDAVMMGFGLPTSNLHSPNENFALSQLHGGSLTAAAFYGELARRR
jgi:acetylornithine deacetylase/succinyl-diaminopimelate desuccinylase-like protein